MVSLEVLLIILRQSQRSADPRTPIAAGVCIICACLPVCWPLASPLFSKIRGSTTSLRDRWRSRNSPHLYGTKSTSDRSRSSKARSEVVSSPGLPDAELLPASRYEPSPDSGAYVSYPQQVRAVSSSDSEDGILVIQGGHYTHRPRFVEHEV